MDRLHHTCILERGALSRSGSYQTLLDRVLRTADSLVQEVRWGERARTTTGYTYDDRRRLRSVQTYRGPPKPVTDPTAPLPELTAPAADLRYAYDASDQRVLKTAEDTATLTHRHTAYLYPTLELRRAVWTDPDAEGSAPEDYELSEQTEVPYLFASSVRLARVAWEPEDKLVPTDTADGFAPSGSGRLHVFLLLGDHLGSTSLVLDSATSELVERPSFEGHGKKESDYRPSRWAGFQEDYGFTGKEEDSEVGLLYFGFRYLSPHLGRWTSPDPLTVHALGADLHLYAYVSGRLLKNTDPLGLSGDEVYRYSDSAGTTVWETPDGEIGGPGSGDDGAVATTYIRPDTIHGGGGFSEGKPPRRSAPVSADTRALTEQERWDAAKDGLRNFFADSIASVEWLANPIGTALTGGLGSRLRAPERSDLTGFAKWQYGQSHDFMQHGLEGLSTASGVVASLGIRAPGAVGSRLLQGLARNPCACFDEAVPVWTPGGTLPLRDVTVGVRVLASVPCDERAMFGWAEVHLVTTDLDGRTVRVTILRPPSDPLHRALVGDEVRLHLEELGLEGWFRVVRILDRDLPSGAGCLVTGTVDHVDHVLALHLEGHPDPLLLTPDHLLWSDTTHRWAPAGALALGELLRTAPGLSATVHSLLPVELSRRRVLNLEVHTAHEMFVGHLGVRAHNVIPCVSAAGGAARATGQLHHAISRPIAKALQEHRTLQGAFQARDPRFVLRAADQAAHRGYQQWHRALDQEVVEWLGRNPTATPAQFESYLRGLYQRPELLQRFPLGFE